MCDIVSLRADLSGANWRRRHYCGNLAGHCRLYGTSWGGNVMEVITSRQWHRYNQCFISLFPNSTPKQVCAQEAGVCVEVRGRFQAKGEISTVTYWSITSNKVRLYMMCRVVSSHLLWHICSFCPREPVEITSQYYHVAIISIINGLWSQQVFLHHFICFSNSTQTRSVCLYGAWNITESLS